MIKTIFKWILGIILFFYLIGWIADFAGYKPSPKITKIKEIQEDDKEIQEDTDKPHILYKAEFTKEWALNADWIILHCENDALWVTANGKIYGLNGYAKPYLESRHIRCGNISDIHIKYKNISPIMEEARKVCK